MLCVPSNFSAYTGPPHWQPLLQARAIENLCYVAAPAQCGVAPDGFASHGHSMIIDPWGTVLAEAQPDPQDNGGILIADLSRDVVGARRAALASPGETRPDVYARNVITGSACVR